MDYIDCRKELKDFELPVFYKTGVHWARTAEEIMTIDLLGVVCLDFYTEVKEYMCTYKTTDITDKIADAFFFKGIVEAGFCWNELTRERMRNPKALESYGYKVFSQNDEDGIIDEVFKRIGITDKRFIEFGVQNGLESNCHLLLFKGWSGLWIEGDENYCKDIDMRFKPVISNGQLHVLNAFITKENINDLINNSEFTGEIDLLSIDIDGNDYYVWESIEAVNPRVVITEYNGKLPPNVEWIQAYNSSHIWRGDDWHGASLKSFQKLAEKKGYRLVGTNLRGCNAFFVRTDLCEDKFLETGMAEDLYNPLRMGLEFKSYHPSRYCLVAQKDELGILNYMDYSVEEGFYPIEEEGADIFAWINQESSSMRLRIQNGMKYICIPFYLPQEVVNRYKDNYVIKITCNDSLERYVDVTNAVDEFRIDLSRIKVNNEVVKVSFDGAILWSPQEILRINDDRMLGIRINLSGIKIYN